MKEKKAKKRAREELEASQTKLKLGTPNHQLMNSPKKLKEGTPENPMKSQKKKHKLSFRVGNTSTPVHQASKSGVAPTENPKPESGSVPNHNSADKKLETNINNWPSFDAEELVNRILGNTTPHVRNMKWSSGDSKVNWEKVKFKNYSAQDCQDMWKHLEAIPRKFRNFEDILNDALAYVKDPTKVKNHKKEVHPDQPKQPQSVYFMFVQKNRQKFKELYPDLKVNELAKKLGEAYKKLSEKDKKKLDKKYEKNKQLYEEQLQKFHKEHPEMLEKGKLEKHRKKTGLNYHPTLERPKKPFQIFVDHRQEKLGEIAVIEKGSLEEEWKNLKDKKKAKFIKMALDYEAEYKKLVKKYNAEHETNYFVPTQSVTTVSERATLDKLAGKPSKPPPNAYSLFTSMELKKGLSFKAASEKWKAMTKPEQDRYTELWNQAKKKYDQDRAEYLHKCSEEDRDRFLSEEKEAEAKRKLKKPGPKAIQSTLDSGLFKFIKQQNPKLNRIPQPVAPPQAEFDFYKEWQLKQNPQLTLPQIINSYKLLSVSGKAALRQQHQKASEKYNEEYNKYLDLIANSDSKSKEEGEVSGSSGTVNANHHSDDDDEDDDDDDEDDDDEDDDDDDDDDDSDSEESKNKTAGMVAESGWADDDEKDVRNTIPTERVQKLAESSDDSDSDSSSSGEDSGSS